jgi:hypothetical protein
MTSPRRRPTDEARRRDVEPEAEQRRDEEEEGKVEKPSGFSM